MGKVVGHRVLLWRMSQMPVSHLSGDINEAVEYVNLGAQGNLGLEFKNGED